MPVRTHFFFQVLTRRRKLFPGHAITLPPCGFNNDIDTTESWQLPIATAVWGERSGLYPR